MHNSRSMLCSLKQCLAADGSAAVHTMISKWLDCAMCLCAFHYQSIQFDDIKPSSFGKLDGTVTADQIRGRDRNFKGISREETVRNLATTPTAKPEYGFSSRAAWKLLRKRRRDPSSPLVGTTANDGFKGKSINSTNPKANDGTSKEEKIPIPMRFQDQFLKGFNRGNSGVPNPANRLVKQSRAFRSITKTRRAKLPTPSLFLQETAHLISLLCAVALSTLRNDIDMAASPVTPYIPGRPWPFEDPDLVSNDIQHHHEEWNALWRSIEFVLGLSRSRKRRTLYNATRPFGVLGGVSDEEIALLQLARGPSAKVALCTMWVQEFITRESMAGSTGNVAPPIISRLYQYVSDGMAGYNQARKVFYLGKFCVSMSFMSSESLTHNCSFLFRSHITHFHSLMAKSLRSSLSPSFSSFLYYTKASWCIWGSLVC
jgi:hypothetical protein